VKRHNVSGDEKPSATNNSPEEDSDESNKKMLEFAAKATADAGGCSDGDLDPQMAGIIDWLARTTTKDVMAAREKATQAIEQLAATFHQKGEVAAWLAGAEEEVRQVIGSVNGPLMAALVKSTGYSQGDVVDMMQKGAPLLGRIPASPDCRPGEYSQARDPSLLGNECKERNEALLASLRNDAHARVP
jgi:hypothetical protein